MKCPKCNAVISDKSVFCTECGAKVENHRVCADCGGMIPEDVLFCPLCGSSSSAKKTDAFSTGEITADAPLKQEDFVYDSDFQGDADESSKKPAFPENSVGDLLEEKVSLAIDSKPDVEEDLEKTMTIPVIKPRAHYGTDAQQNSVNPVPGYYSGSPVPKDEYYGYYPDKVLSQPVPGPRPGAVKSVRKTTGRKSSEQTGRNVLIFIIVFLSVVLIGLSAIFIYIAYSGTGDETVQNISSKDTNTQGSTQDDENEKDDAPDTEESSSKSIEPFEPKIDLGYDFAEGVEIAADVSSDRKYTQYQDDKYSFQCDIPEIFKIEFSGRSEVRYSAEDGTAYMDIGALKNTKGWSSENIKDAVADELGGDVEYETDGDDFFVVEAEKNGIFYYQKCYVTEDSICYVEFVFPVEYKSGYEDFASEVGASFKQKK